MVAVGWLIDGRARGYDETAAAVDVEVVVMVGVEGFIIAAAFEAAGFELDGMSSSS